jgi:hypothetical protein
MRFLLLIIGPFSWHASVSGVRFEWNTNVSLMGGLAAATPTKVGASIRRQLLVLIAGGPVASLLLAMFALAATSVSGPRFAAYFTFIAGSSFGIFLITLMPIRSSGFLSDGLQLIDVLRGGDAVRERVALLQIFAQSAAGIRPRDWDSQVISELSRMNSADPLGGSMFLLARAMDNHDHAEIAHSRQSSNRPSTSIRRLSDNQSMSNSPSVPGWPGMRRRFVNSLTLARAGLSRSPADFSRRRRSLSLKDGLRTASESGCWQLRHWQRPLTPGSEN